MDAAIVFTAAKAAIPQAFRALRRNGTLILVGLAATSYELPLVDTVLKGITIRGSYLGSREDLAAVFGLARAGRVASARADARSGGDAGAAGEDAAGRDRRTCGDSVLSETYFRAATPLAKR